MEIQNSLSNYFKKPVLVLPIIVVAVVLLVIIFSMTPPDDLENPKIIKVEKGESVRSISSDLKRNGIIRSKTIFNLYIQLSKKSTISSGDYLFESPENVLSVANRMKNSDFRLPIFLITITEGQTNAEVADLLSKKLLNFSKEDFLIKANSLEGYLFPDTYKLFSNATEEEIISLLEANFKKKIDSIKQTIDSSKYSIDQIVTMASIIEAESTADGRQEVSNILWRRFEIGMALQVDAPFVYAIGKGTADLTTSDLKSDSPYNTYTRVGLTPTPIGNPGLDSIIAAAKPQPTQNLYFLTGRDGKMYYARTFNEHRRNILKYLK